MQDRIASLNKFIERQHILINKYDKDFNNLNPIYRAEKEIELLKLGCRVEDDQHGLLVNGKYIVGISKKRWCVKGKYVWYWYKDLSVLVENILK